MLRYNLVKLSIFFPYGYGCITRIKSIVHKISFFIIYVIPVFYFALNSLQQAMVNGDFLLRIAIAFTETYCIYEIGYIYNDIFTRKKEKSPTNWFDNDGIERFVEQNYILLISVRVIYLTVGIVVLLLANEKNLPIFVIFLGLLYFTFSLHNYFRDKRNVLTDFFLNFFKYLTPVVLFVSSYQGIKNCIYLFFEIIIVRSLEFALGKGYFFSKLNSFDVDVLRVYYYAVLTLIAFVFWLAGFTNYTFLLSTVYFLIYRVFCIAVGRNRIIKNEREKNNGKK